MLSRPLPLATLTMLLAGACSGSTPNGDRSPSDLSITPSQGYSSDPVATVITGTGFFAKAPQPQGGGEAALDTRHHAWIGQTVLDVTWRSTTTLDATVPRDVAPGTYDLTVENALGNRGTLKAAYTVLPPRAFSATAIVDHPSVNVGQALALTVTFANRGTGEITDFALGTPALEFSNGGAASPGRVPTAQSRLEAGGQQPYTWTYTPSHTGNISITASATGMDSTSGEVLTAALAAPVAVVVQTPAALTSSLSAGPVVDQRATMTLELANAAGAASVDVTAVTPSANPAAGMVCSAAEAASTGAAPSAAAPLRIAGGTTEGITWTCTASAVGIYTLGAEVAAGDVNAGTSIATSVTGIDVPYGTLPAPTFSPPPGAYPSAQAVAIGATAGAEIHYTIDGSEPTASCATYLAPINVTATTTIRAIAVANGMSSPVATGTYTITGPAATPTFDPAPGAYATAQSVAIGDTTPSASIYYSTDGSTPSATSTTSTRYAGTIPVDATTTIKAVAVAPNFADSAIAEATYTIGVTIYEHIDYGGASQQLQAGRYDVAQLAIGNDAVSSVRVPPHWRVTLYQDGGFSGETRILTSDTPTLVDLNFNDQTSSIVVERM